MRLVYREGGSEKFWEGRIEGTNLVVTFGKLGTKGQTKVFGHDRVEAAQRDLDKRSGQKRKEGYVEEGAAPAPPKDEGPPFRFYGHLPSDWLEGANEGHFYEVAFAKAPKAAPKKKIAQAFEKGLAKGPAEPAQAAWRWADRFALFAIGERAIGDEGGAGPAFEAVAEVLKTIHGIAPIEQVVFLGARELGGGEWERRSVAARAKPVAGPAWSGLDKPDPYGAGVDRALGEDDEDADFEDARLEARLGKKAVAEARAASARATGSTEISVVPIKEKDLPLRPLPDFRALVAVGAHANPQLAGDGMVFFRPIERELFHVVFARADGSEPRAIPGEVRGRGFPPPLAVSPDAARFATSDYDAATSSFHVFEADVATGARTSLGTFPSLPQLAYLAGDHLLVNLYAKELMLLGPARAPVQRVEASVYELVRIDEDVALAGPTFYGLYGDRLVEIGRVPGTSRVYAAGGKVVGENAGKPVEILNVRAAYEAKR